MGTINQFLNLDLSDNFTVPLMFPTAKDGIEPAYSSTGVEKMQIFNQLGLNASIDYDIQQLRPGTYKVDIIHTQSGNGGIASFYIGGAKMTEIALDGTGENVSASSASFTHHEGGAKTFKVKIESSNTAGYECSIHAIQLTRQ